VKREGISFLFLSAIKFCKGEQEEDGAIPNRLPELYR
jgi:hypothetical protein